jgi:hypothetical protein
MFAGREGEKKNETTSSLMIKRGWHDLVLEE